MLQDSLLNRVALVATRFLEISGALVLFAMMLLTFVDVIGRYLFNSPVFGGFEITEIMLATMIYCGLPLISMREGHVTVDLLDSLFRGGIRVIQQLVVRLMMIAALIFLGLWLWEKGGQFYRYNDMTALLNVPLYPVVYFMAISCFLSAVLTVYAMVTRGKTVGRISHD